MAKSSRLIYTELGENSNKYWHGDIIGTSVKFEWGRIGEGSQSKTKQFASEYAAEKELDRKIREKLRGGYTEQQTIQNNETKSVSNIAYVAKYQIEHNNDTETIALIDFLVQRNIHAIEGTTSIRLAEGKLSTPLGPVTLQGLDEAGLLLEKILKKDKHFADLVNQYLRIVPRAIGRTKIDPNDILGTNKLVATEQTLVDSLRAVVKDAEQRSSSSSVPIFEAKLKLVEQKAPSFTHINSYYNSSINRMHQSSSLRLKRVWEMSIAKHDQQFEQQLGNIKELWHGTSDANLLSILKNGFIIPRQGSSVKITGRAYGDGIYFSDQSSKSLNYCGNYWGGTGSKRSFMLLNDVAMGREFMATRGFSGTIQKGYDSCFAKAGTAVRNNEMIIYRSTQVRPKYLVEFG